MIVTFYSYKGGVGRSMALVNVGEYLARRGVPVILVDWDLEAPGLERYFPILREDVEEQPGVIDLLLEYRQAMAQPTQPALEGKAIDRLPVASSDLGRALGFTSPRECLIDIGESVELPSGVLRLLPAGRRAGDRFGDYASNVQTFDWSGFYRDWEGEAYLDWFRQELLAEDSLILVDSRTGVTEIGGVCVYQLADVVVMLCAANSSNLDGTVSMAKAFSRPVVKKLRGDRPLHILPVPARIPKVEQIQEINGFLNEFADRLGDYYQKLGLDPETTARRFWIPQIPLYSFRERVAVRETGRSPFRNDDLTKVYSDIASTIATLAPKDSSLAKRLQLEGAVLRPLPGGDPSLSEERLEEIKKRSAERVFGRFLRAASLAWEQSGRQDAFLIRGSALAKTESLMRSRPGDLLAGESLFIEASLKLKRVRRRKYALAWAAVLVTIIVAVFVSLLQHSRVQALRLESWGLPQELPSWIGRLETLKLPEAVNRIDWLDGAKSLKHLDLSRTNVTDIKGLPSSLLSLDLGETQITELSDLPSSLQELDLSYTRIRSLRGLPPSLRRLNIEGTAIDSLAGLPSNISDLTIDADRLENLENLPRSLLVLNVSGFHGTQLPRLPKGLRSLSLTGTELQTLDNLPPFLESLSLIGNRNLRLNELPKGLNSLTVASTPIPIDLAGLPRGLSILVCQEVSLRSAAGLPGALRDLTLEDVSGESIDRLPGSLRSLTLGPQELARLSGFPDSLESLALRGAVIVSVKSLPRSVVSLDIGFSNLSDVKGLPENLGKLGLDYTNIGSLDGLPVELRSLELRGTRVHEIFELPVTLEVLDVSDSRDFASLGRLPKSLKELNVSNTAIAELGELPLSLRILDVSGSKIQRLQKFPPHLEKLSISPLQVKEFNRLPSSLRELYLIESQLKPGEFSSGTSLDAYPSGFRLLEPAQTR